MTGTRANQSSPDLGATAAATVRSSSGVPLFKRYDKHYGGQQVPEAGKLEAIR